MKMEDNGMKRLFTKKIVAFLVVMTMIVVTGIDTKAADNACPDDDYIIINGSEKVPMFQDYYNPETGEYFHWHDVIDSKGTIAKSFSFKIRYSIESSKFTINSTSVYVDAWAEVQDSAGNSHSGYDGHRYSIEIFSVFLHKLLQFDIGGVETGTLSGFTAGNKYKMIISNNDLLPNSTYYLVGAGTIENN